MQRKSDRANRAHQAQGPCRHQSAAKIGLHRHQSQACSNAPSVAGSGTSSSSNQGLTGCRAPLRRPARSSARTGGCDAVESGTCGSGSHGPAGRDRLDLSPQRHSSIVRSQRKPGGACHPGIMPVYVCGSAKPPASRERRALPPRATQRGDHPTHPGAHE